MKPELEKTTNIEELRKWQEELYELERYACTSRLSEEEEERLVKKILNEDKSTRLNKLEARREKLIKTLEIVEQRISWLKEEIESEHHSP